MKKSLFAVTLAVSAFAIAPTASATTFPTLTTIYVMSGARDDGTVATSIVCTNVSGLTASLRILVLHSDSSPAGVFTSNLLHGHTVVVSTGDTALFIESGDVGAGLIQGAVNVESSQSGVFCSAAIIDAVGAPDFTFPLHVVRVNPHPGTVE